ncbi:MAG: Asp-tRNA(Asn)/Glu-tRNA(Gln) amidotransferase subunit GatB [Pseudomonadales bacterium]|nr:Asp-tRNA(Asn)/Glu-tRNA(Gln) amidotransferase subunit GatB [Candidatus Woesebacteria bacterium]MCB9802102.1 Asp-tRNA(Asn)/Glu-tRNA(Gln) amidotransferase subunit GatB [Pseudomonadales bacterium]
MNAQNPSINRRTEAYTLICGMEVHAELKTASKMFCGCTNNPFFAEKPNTHTCPVCLGMPGGLPVANKTAIEWTIKLGLALGCDINLFSKFDRKHYFYPDLPKGYQISQYDIPFCTGGAVETSHGPVRLTRIHLEEDTAKMIHATLDGEKVSMIDHNRAGVPLVEIVSEPDVTSPAQAAEYGRNLREIMRYLEIADCDMEQGGMRLEANISLQSTEQAERGQLPEYKVEVKNINSFRFLENAISHEVERQGEVLDTGVLPAQETRGYNSTKDITFTQRAKEDAADYRYMPDPDLPPFQFAQSQIKEWQHQLPELPGSVRTRWSDTYGLNNQALKMLVVNAEQTAWLDSVFALAEKQGILPKKIAAALVNKQLEINPESTPESVLKTYQKQTASSSVDAQQLSTTIQKILTQHPDAVAKYQAGETQVLGFFMGQAMRVVGNNADAGQVRVEIERQLKQL